MRLIARPAPPAAVCRNAALPIVALYTGTMFVSAALLFVVEPMFARMVLPLLGGSPAVWNTAVVVYQALLLAGYGYAHLSARWLTLRQQAAAHAGVVLLPLLVLPIRIPGGRPPPAQGSPIPWLLAVLVAAVGLPFFAVSAGSPLLQAWFARSGHRAVSDPYFLYAASNVGSMLALLAYPVVIEPHLRLAQQSHLWQAGYGLLVLLTLGCVTAAWRSHAGTSVRAVEEATAPTGEPAPALRRRLRWVALAFVPSSLMLSVTTYLTTNVAPMPLLWVIPLALYLLTFILAFSRRTVLPRSFLMRALPLALLPLVITMVSQINRPLQLLMLLHLATFFIAAMLCHGRLAADRPSARHLTGFYLWLSVGGVLGGLFNALLAPVIFTGITEYPLVLTALCLLQAEPEAVSGLWRRKRGLALPVAAGLLTAALLLLLHALTSEPNPAYLAAAVCLPAFACFVVSRRPLQFGLAIGALLLAGTLYGGSDGELLHAERGFFGLLRITTVTTTHGRRFHELLHSGTLHGVQSLDPGSRDVPLTYYHPTGPIGQLFTALPDSAMQRVAIVGLGAGSLACYARPGEAWTFYEIDSAVVRLAEDTRYFTFLHDCTPGARMVLGDARLALNAAPRAAYDVLVVDAFSGDTVPIHLLTREALALYLDKLGPHGVLAFNISNRYLDLRPVLGNLAHAAGLVAFVQTDLYLSAEDNAGGKTASQWVAMARASGDLPAVASDPRSCRGAMLAPGGA